MQRNGAVKELAGEVAVVTGGTRGIGLAIARELADAGARVSVLATREEAAARVAAGLPGEGHLGRACDVRDGSACRKTVARTAKELGTPSILINNAGIARDGLALRMKDEDWASVLDTNLTGAFHMIRATLRHMVRSRRGAIVNVSSVVGISGNAGQANYAASKAGLHGLSKSVAKEWASRGIRCNVIAPGLIRTDMTSDLAETPKTELLRRIPLGRMGAPEEVAALARFLVGPGGRYITGQIIAVDGGMSS